MAVQCSGVRGWHFHCKLLLWECCTTCRCFLMHFSQGKGQWGCLSISPPAAESCKLVLHFRLAIPIQRFVLG